jgi:hypothetical protein
MYVYFIKAKSKPPMVKIGRAKDPEHRLVELQIGCPFELKLVGKLKCRSEEHTSEAERHLHHLFRRDRQRGEWFKYINNVPRIISAIVADAQLGSALDITRIFHEATRPPVPVSRATEQSEYHSEIDTESLSHLRSIRAEGRA